MYGDWLTPPFMAGNKVKRNWALARVLLKYEGGNMSFVRIWVHCVWGTKNRVPFLTKMNIYTIINHIKENAVEKGIYIDFINGHKEHIHCIISLSPGQCISDVIRLIKGESSFWINNSHLINTTFGWADEYYAVSVSESQINKVRDYIKNQGAHHRQKTWKEECEEFIKKYGFVNIQG